MRFYAAACRRPFLQQGRCGQSSSSSSSSASYPSSSYPSSSSSSSEVKVVAAAFGGADARPATVTLVLEEDEKVESDGSRYIVLLLCLGNAPTAATTTQQQPFSVRFYSSAPIEVECWETTVKSQSSLSKGKKASVVIPKRPALVLAAWHGAILLPPAAPSSFVTSTSPFLPTDTSPAEARVIRPFALPRSSLKVERLMHLSNTCCVLVVRGEGALIIFGINSAGSGHISGGYSGEKPQFNKHLVNNNTDTIGRGTDNAIVDQRKAVRLNVKVYAKSYIARCSTGIISNDTVAAKQYTEVEFLRKKQREAELNAKGIKDRSLEFGYRP